MEIIKKQKLTKKNYIIVFFVVFEIVLEQKQSLFSMNTIIRNGSLFKKIQLLIRIVST